MIRSIVDTKNPKLREKSKPINKIDKKVRELAQDLVDTLKAQKDPEGVGLAAPQIGKNVCMFAMVWENDIRVIINPEIISIQKTSKKKKKKAGKTILEGCLSIPNFYGPLKRPQQLTLKFMDLNGKIKTEVFKGFPAQIVQHEVDHLIGVLFIEKLLQQRGKLYRYDSKTDDWEEVELI